MTAERHMPYKRIFAKYDISYTLHGEPKGDEE
jgi:hypothetical protein